MIILVQMVVLLLKPIAWNHCFNVYVLIPSILHINCTLTDFSYNKYCPEKMRNFVILKF